MIIYISHSIECLSGHQIPVFLQVVSHLMIRFLFRLISLFLLMSLNSAAWAIINGRVITPPPDIVLILSDRGGICTGSIISDHVIVTGAHCVEKTGNIAVYYKTGSGKEHIIKVERIAVHPRYRPIRESFNSKIVMIDLALLKTEEKLPGRKAVALSLGRPEKNEMVQISGFGQFDEKKAPDGQLRTTKLNVVEPHGRGKVVLWLKGSNGNGACEGDSGGPVHYQDKLAAIIFCASGHGRADCGNYTQGLLLAPQKNWIDGTLSKWGEKAQWQ